MWDNAFKIVFREELLVKNTYLVLAKFILRKKGDLK